ncbi:TPA: hypothetical protein ACW4HL_002451 [Salmonella enterica subsp. enterica serovar Cerro]
MTTNNHPAHGPVSLDRLHQIRETLSKASAQSDGGNLGYAMADAVKVIDLAIAAFGAEPVLYAMQGVNLDTDTISTCKNVVDGWVDEWNQERKPGVPEYKTVPLYTAPPAPVVPTFDEWLAIRGDKPLGWVKDAMRESYDACRAAMLQSFGNSEQLDEVGSWNNHMNTPTANPAIDTGALLKHIEGMEVSVDVSTCDADAGHRYFGTVTEISELDTAKNGYILLVQDAKPNFKQAGNSPVIGIDLASDPDRSVEVRYLAPPGYAMVPKELTCEMDDAAWEAYHETRSMSDIWAALLAAAPQQEVNP